jgi:very-short-patch-repair endonuclease
MQQSTPLIAAVLVAVLAIGLRAALKRPVSTAGAMTARRVLTKHEQAMFWRLTETFPELVVLAQVAFSALITTRARQDRNRFDKKVADFVLCDRSLAVIAVIELDDASHNGRETADAKRAALLEQAGYRVLRFPRIPDTAQLRTALATPAPTTPPMAKSP